MAFKDNDKARIFIDTAGKNTESGKIIFFDAGYLFDSGTLFDQLGNTALMGERAKISFEHKRSHVSLTQD